MREINEIELAAELAHQATAAELIHDLPSEYPDEEYVYKPHVQDLFNNYYDYYLEMIDNCEIKQLI